MFVVNAAGGGERSGCLIGFATQTSIDPPRFLVGLSNKNRTYRVSRRAENVAVHFVPADAEELAELFGGETGDEVDKFARCAWHEGPHGLPLLDDCPDWFAGEVLEQRPLGDHDVLILEPIAAERAAEGEELTFHRAKRLEPGHAP